MAGKLKTTDNDWTSTLDESDVREALDEATVDCYNDEHEQHTGLLTAIDDELQFPFNVQVMGQTVSVVDSAWPQDDPFGLDLVVERDGKQYAIEARSAQLTQPYPEGHLFLAAYLDWKRRM